MSFEDDALAYHRHPRPGKLSVEATKPLESQRDLSLAYSPGVAEPCRVIADDPERVFDYTGKGNLVAVVTNGSAVLGLGNIGPLAGKPVMEGKANLFKKFADIDVFDIELDADTVDEMVAAVKAIAPTFGGINLEDIKAPEAFEVEARLTEALDIPVFHDDQHGTAIISAAALLNACELTERHLPDVVMVISGAGAAAIACARLYVSLGMKAENITMLDSKGVLTTSRDDLHERQLDFAQDTHATALDEVIEGADVFIGLSVGGVLKPEMLAKMADDPIVFAMANPDPEIDYELARSTRPDAIVATGRSDHPNQVNNVLGFPFVFRGALDCRARTINEEMKRAATEALAELARQEVPDTVLRAYGLEGLTFGREYLIPKPFDPRVLLYVAPAVAEAAARTGVARQPIEDLDAYRERLHRTVERARGLMSPLISRARSQPDTRIVFTDGDEPRVIRAASILREQQICAPILMGNPERIHRRAAEIGLDLDGIRIQDSSSSDSRDELADHLWRQRQRLGVTRTAARSLLKDRAWHGAMMVREGRADGMVGGLGRPYKATLSPVLTAIGTAPGIERVSGAYALLVGDRRLFLGDCTVNLYPDAEGLAQIALNTARIAEHFGETPRVAMLSYSDFGEHRDDPRVTRVRRAVEIVRERRPDLEVDGEMQADTAIDPEKMQGNFPFAALEGPANVLVFPDLPSGNIAYKLLVKLSGAEAVGPLLTGLADAASVIPVHATVSEIVHLATYTVDRALDRRRVRRG